MILAWLRSIFSNSEPVTGHDDPDAWHIDTDGWLHGLGIVRLPSVRHSALAVMEPTAIVWHYTATDYGTASGLAKRIRKYRAGVDRAASWHLLVGVDGTIYQSVSLLRGAWHCSAGRVDGVRVNRCSIGVELEGHGEADQRPQIEAAERLARLLVAEYGIGARNAALEHSKLDPKRRDDPGPRWTRIVRDAVGEVLPVSRGRR